jgi:hypothetical protein
LTPIPFGAQSSAPGNALRFGCGWAVLHRQMWTVVATRGLWRDPVAVHSFAALVVA